MPVLADSCMESLTDGTARLRDPAHKPVITGHAAADSRIRLLAESRGYRLQSILADESELAFPWSIHRCVLPAWRRMRSAALEQGFALSIVSGYRSVARQRQIFLSKLEAAGVSVEQIAAGEADRKIQDILEFSAIPGYSRHHTGFTIDIQHGDAGLSAFGDSPAYHWLAADNFRIARQHGFVPSYPEELPGQGPVPEPWEFIWVGDSQRLAGADPADTLGSVLLESVRDILYALDQSEPRQTLATTAERRGVRAAVDSLPGG